MPMHHRLPRFSLINYSLLAFPLAFAGIPLYVHAPFFYANEYKLSLVTIGIILPLIRVVDAVQDLLIGMLSDRYANLRRAIVLAGLALLAGGIWMLFHGVQSAIAVWFFISMLMVTTAFSVVSININAMGGIWSKDSVERTRITAYREGFGLIGLLCAVALPSVLEQSFPAQEAFHYFSLILVAVTVFVAVLFWRWFAQESALFTAVSKTPFSFANMLQPLKTHRGFFLIYGLSVLASAIPAILVLFFIQDRLKAYDQAAIFLVLYLLSGVVSMPLWQAVAKRFGKANAWLYAMLLAVVTFLWAFFLGEGDLIAYGIICVTSGMALGAELAIPPSILADLIAKAKETKTASRHFAMIAFLMKTCLALASALILPSLDIAGYQAGKENAPHILWTISFCYALLPCMIKLVAVSILWKKIRNNQL